jgi:hypothetical protein
VNSKPTPAVGLLGIARHHSSRRSDPRGRVVNGRARLIDGGAVRPLSWWPRTRRPHRCGELVRASDAGSRCGAGHCPCPPSAPRRRGTTTLRTTAKAPAGWAWLRVDGRWPGTRGGPRPNERFPVDRVVRGGALDGQPTASARRGSAARRPPRRAGPGAPRRTRHPDPIMIVQGRPPTPSRKGADLVRRPNPSSPISADRPEPSPAAAGNRREQSALGRARGWAGCSPPALATASYRALGHRPAPGPRVLLRQADLSDDERYDLLRGRRRDRQQCARARPGIRPNRSSRSRPRSASPGDDHGLRSRRVAGRHRRRPPGRGTGDDVASGRHHGRRGTTRNDGDDPEQSSAWSAPGRPARRARSLQR